MRDMADEQENLAQLEQLVEQCLEKRMAQFAPPLQLERSANLGAELRHQRELMQQGFENADKRFEAMDKRFEELRSDMNQRFEAVDKRFEAVDKRFEELRSDMNQRFEELRRDMNQHFEMLITLMDRRFEAVDKRFEAVDRRFAFMQWLILAGFGALSLMLTFYKFFTV